MASAAIFGMGRHRSVAEARQIAIWLLRRRGYSLPQIGAAMARDHTTVLHAIRKIEATPDLLEIARGIEAGLDVKGLARWRWL